MKDNLRVLGTLVSLAGLALPAAAQPPAKPAALPPIAPGQARLDQTIGGLDGPGFAVAYNEAAGVLAVACERSAVRYWNKGVTMGVRVGEGTPNLLQGHQGPVTAMAWGTGPFLASAGADQKVLLWAMPEGKIVHTLTPGCVVRALATSPDGKLLTGGGEDGRVYLWDVTTGKPTATLAGHTDWVLSLAFSPDGKLLASGSHDGTARVWDVAAGREALTLPGKPPNAPPGPMNSILALAFSPDGKQLALGGTDAQVHVIDLADTARLQAARAAGTAALGTDLFAPVAPLLMGQLVKVVRSIPGHTSSITALAFHPSGAVLVSASKDRTIRLWNPANGQLLKALEGHTAWVQDVKFLAQGTRLASVGADQTVRLWDLTDPAKK